MIIAVTNLLKMKKKNLVENKDNVFGRFFHTFLIARDSYNVNNISQPWS